MSHKFSKILAKTKVFSIFLTLILSLTGCGAIGGMGGGSLLTSLLGAGVTSTTGETGTTGISGTTITDTTTSEDDSGNNATQEGTGVVVGNDSGVSTESGTVDTASGGSDAMPQASIPTANLNGTTIANASSSSSSVIQGGGLTSGYYLKVTNASGGGRLEQDENRSYFAKAVDALLRPYEMAADLFKVRTGKMPANRFYARYYTGTEKYQIQNFYKHKDRSMMYAVVSTIVGQDAYATDSTNIQACEDLELQTTCILIDADGNIPATELTGVIHADTFRISYVDPATLAEGDPTEDSSLTNLHYLGGNFANNNSVAFDGTNNKLYTLIGTGTLAKLDYSESYDGFEVSSGEFEDNYRYLTTADTHLDDATGIAYNASNTDLNTVDSTNSVEAWNIMPSTVDGTTVETVAVVSTAATHCIDPDNNCSIVEMKVKGERTYFSTERSEVVDTTVDTSAGTISELYGTNANAITFLNSGNYQETYAFDVYDDGTYYDGLAVFSDGTNIMLAGDNTDVTINPVVSSPLNLSNVVDLTIYSDQPNDDLDDGKAVLLTQNSIRFVYYDFFAGDEESGTDGTSVALDDDNIITDVTNAVAMAWNESTTSPKAFILSQGTNSTSNADDYITVVDLTTKAVDRAYTTALNSEWTNGKIMLSAVLANKEVDFTGSTIQYVTTTDNRNYLIIGADSLDSVVTVDLN